jgi:hypothetical protein
MRNQSNKQPKKNKGTFVIQIQHRQHATWQGTVTWVDKDKSVNFRSALELLKLIDGSLDEEWSGGIE